MAKGKRDARGRFVRKSRSRSKASNPRKRRRATSSRARTTTRRRTYRRRRNPPKVKILGQLMDGVKDAGGIIIGKAAARAIPTMTNLPKQGALGLAVQAGVALAAGIAAHRFVGRDFGRMVLAGGLTAPLETAIVANNVPLLGPALSPATGATQVGLYSLPSRGMGVYSLPAMSGPRRVAGYAGARDTASVAGVEEDFEHALY